MIRFLPPTQEQLLLLLRWSLVKFATGDYIISANGQVALAAMELGVYVQISRFGSGYMLQANWFTTNLLQVIFT